KKIVSEHAKQYEPQDPYYYEVIDPITNKVKRRKRPPPPGLTKKQAKLLRKIARRAHYLDKGFYICGLRFGWTFILGLVPGVGDVADAVLNYSLVVKPLRKQDEIPDWLITNMLINNAVSAGIGIIPLVGDVMLAVWKANSRNAKLLEEYYRVLGEEQMNKGLPDLTPNLDVTHPAQSRARELVYDSNVGAGTGAG
ncbi:hypothetical protein K437DRAFT_212853, partial [Tilletiaria anomala UBC 951]